MGDEGERKGEGGEGKETEIEEGGQKVRGETDCLQGKTGERE